MIKHFYTALFGFWNKWKIKSLIKNKQQSEIHFFDIDNTLANTWPCIAWRNQDYTQWLESLPVFLGMRQEILNKQMLNFPCVFLTSRNWNAGKSTVNWLNSIGLHADNSNTFITSTPEEKLKLISIALNNMKTVSYYDDLSFNHETGSVGFYEDAILAIKKMPIHYYSKSDIDNINKSFGKKI